MAYIKAVIEDYFKEENLLKFISPADRNKLYPSLDDRYLLIPVALNWVLLSALTDNFWKYAQWTIVIVLAFIIAFLGLRTKIGEKQFWLVSIGKGNSKHKILIQVVMLIVTPIVISLLLAIWVQSIAIPSYYLISLFVLVLLKAWVDQNHVKISYKLSVFRSTLKTLQSAIFTSFRLIPFLVIVILLSIFSQEFWIVASNASVVRFLLFSFMLLIPSLLFSRFAIRQWAVDTASYMEGYDMNLVERFIQIKYFQSLINNNQIVERDIFQLKADLDWRSLLKKKKEHINYIKSEIYQHATTYFYFVAIVVSVLFFVFFVLVFMVGLDPDIVYNWTSQTPIVPLLQIPLVNIVLKLPWILPNAPIFRVSGILSVFACSLFLILAFTDKNYRSLLFKYWEGKAMDWLATAIVYLCSASPNYVEIEDEFYKRGQHDIDAYIIVRPDLSDDDIRDACIDMLRKIKKPDKPIAVIALEKMQTADEMLPDWDGKYWICVVNPKNGYFNFSAHAGPAVIKLYKDVSQDHMLGTNCEATGVSIPAKWFGNNRKAIALGRKIWREEFPIKFIHPLIYVNDDYMSCEIWVDRRFVKSHFYRALMLFVFSMISDHVKVKMRTISITCKLIFSEQELARVDYFRSSVDNNDEPRITYMDEYQKEKYEELFKWEPENYGVGFKHV